MNIHYKKIVLFPLSLWLFAGATYTAFYAMASSGTEAFWCSGWGYPQGTLCDNSLYWLKVVTVAFPAILAPAYSLRLTTKGPSAIASETKVVLAAIVGSIIALQAGFLIALLQWFSILPCSSGWWCETANSATIKDDGIMVSTLIIIHASFPLYLLVRILKGRI